MFNVWIFERLSTWNIIYVPDNCWLFSVRNNMHKNSTLFAERKTCSLFEKQKWFGICVLHFLSHFPALLPHKMAHSLFFPPITASCSTVFFFLFGEMKWTKITVFFVSFSELQRKMFRLSRHFYHIHFFN